MGVVYHDGNFDFVCDDIRTPEDHLGKVLKVDCLNKIALGSYSSYSVSVYKLHHAKFSVGCTAKPYL